MAGAVPVSLCHIVFRELLSQLTAIDAITLFLKNLFSPVHLPACAFPAPLLIPWGIVEEMQP